MDINELRKEKTELVRENRAMLDEHEDSGDLPGEKREEFDENLERIEELGEEIERLQRFERQELQVSGDPDDQRVGSNLTPEQADEVSRDDEYKDAFWTYVRGGVRSLSSRQYDILHRGLNAEGELRDLSAGVDAEGGFTVPEDFSDQLEVAMQSFVGVMESNATVLPTETGRDLPWPTTNDTTNKGSRVGENTAVDQTDPTFGEVVLQSSIYTSDEVPVSRVLLQDEGVGLEERLSEMLGARIGRKLNEDLTTGTGNDQPEGIVTAADVGATAAAVDAITFDDLLELQHSVDPAYRNDNAQWMFHDSVLKEIRGLTDDDGQPIFQESFRDDAPATILGDPFQVNQDMEDTLGAENETVLYGDLSKYVVRDVMGIEILRLDERRAEKFQVSFIAFSRFDGRLLDAGTGPIKLLDMAAA